MKDPREYTAQAEHPDEETLRAFLREGIRAQETEQILLHLDRCTACEQRLEELEPLFRLHRELRIANLPKSPIWGDLSSAMDSIDRKRRTRVPRPAWMGTVAAGAAICAFLLWPTGRQAELRAETLLRQAERSASTEKNRLEVRSSAGSFIRPAVLKGKTGTDAVGLRFAAAHYDWDDPLAPASYGKWRDRLKTKKITVVEKGGQARIETDTSESDLVAASLTIAENSMTVIAGRFEFADRQWVEITAIPDAVEGTELMPMASVSPREPAPAPSGRFVQTLPERELHVWAALDRLGLSAGAPVSVVAGAGDRIQVIAYRLESDQERQLRASLSGVEGVTLELPPADDSGVPASSKAVDSAINASESILARAHFLDRLASRFPTLIEAALSQPDRKTLWEMRTRHIALMNQDIEALGNKLAKIARFSPLSPSSATPSTQALLESATVVDRLVTGVFATVNSDPLWDRLREEFPRLRQMSLEYARSLGEAPSR
jgi:hypothetical protein